MSFHDEEAKVPCRALELKLGHTQSYWQSLSCDNLYEVGHLIFILIFLQAVCFFRDCVLVRVWSGK